MYAIGSIPYLYTNTYLYNRYVNYINIFYNLLYYKLVFIVLLNYIQYKLLSKSIHMNSI